MGLSSILRVKQRPTLLQVSTGTKANDAYTRGSTSIVQTARIVPLRNVWTNPFLLRKIFSERSFLSGKQYSNKRAKEARSRVSGQRQTCDVSELVSFSVDGCGFGL
jgi:ABC-type sugar transport system ATPase subunit